jgi:uncharacterized protein YebE (UPF0316 family)
MNLRVNRLLTVQLYKVSLKHSKYMAMENSFFNSDLFSYGLLPVLIFLARICDVSIGTLRIIFVSKGKKYVAPILGFFEVLIWITAVSKIMQNLDNYVNYVAYAAGFATGNFVGMIIEEKLAMGIQMIRVFSYQNGPELVSMLNNNGYGATTVEAYGAKEKVHLIYTIVKRNELKNVLEVIDKFNPKAFYTIEDVKAVNEGIFPARKHSSRIPFANILREWRKGK